MEEVEDSDMGTTFALTQTQADPGYHEEDDEEQTLFDDEPGDTTALEPYQYSSSTSTKPLVVGAQYTTDIKPYVPPYEESKFVDSPVYGNTYGLNPVFNPRSNSPIRSPKRAAPMSEADAKFLREWEKPHDTSRLAKMSAACWNSQQPHKNVVLPRINTFKQATRAKPKAFYQARSPFVSADLQTHTGKSKDAAKGKKKKWKSASDPLPKYNNAPYVKPALPVHEGHEHKWWNKQAHFAKINGSVVVGTTNPGGHEAMGTKISTVDQHFHLQKIRDEYAAIPKEVYRGPIDLDEEAR